jgi:hypothetical protein
MVKTIFMNSGMTISIAHGLNRGLYQRKYNRKTILMVSC